MRVRFIPLLLLVLSISLRSQELKPNEEETQRLAKLKNKILLNRAELDSLNIKIYALNRDIILKQQDVNKAITDLNLAASDVKEAHKKDWGEPKDIDYQASTNNDNADNEGGIFTKIIKSENKEEIKPNGGENESKKRQEEERRKINK